MADRNENKGNIELRAKEIYDLERKPGLTGFQNWGETRKAVKEHYRDRARISCDSELAK